MTLTYDLNLSTCSKYVQGHSPLPNFVAVTDGLMDTWDQLF